MHIYWNKRKRQTRKEFNFHKIGLEQQHVRRFMVGVASCENAL